MDTGTEIFKLVAGVDVISVVFIVYKINLADYAPAFSKDPSWIRKLRNRGFLILGAALAWAVVDDGSRDSLRGLFYAGSLCVITNVLALQYRNKK